MAFVSDIQIQKIKDAIVGINVILGPQDFGVVDEIIVEIDNSCTNLIAHTNLGFYFNANQLYSLLRKVRGEENAKYYPQGTDYANRVSGPKVKSKGGGGSLYPSGISNTARIGNESIDISKRPD